MPPEHPKVWTNRQNNKLRNDVDIATPQLPMHKNGIPHKYIIRRPSTSVRIKHIVRPQQDDSQKDEYAGQNSAPTAVAKIDRLTLRLSGKVIILAPSAALGIHVTRT
jgi:hypothetical protein